MADENSELLGRNYRVALLHYLDSARDVVHTLWRRITGDWVFSVYATDLNGDGKLKIVAGSEDRSVYVLDGSGQVLWSYETKDRIRSVYAADLDQDGSQEILAGSEDRSLYVLSADGKLLMKPFLGERINQVKAADIDGDGEVEIVCGLDNGELAILRHDGTRKFTIQTGSIIHALTIMPMSSEAGPMAIVTGLEEGEIVAFGGRGERVFQYAMGSAVLALAGIQLAAPARFAVAAAATNGLIALIDEAGNELWRDELQARAYSVASGRLGAHGEPRLVFGLENQVFHVYTLQGERVWSYLSEDWVLSLCTADLNGDKVDEIIAGQGDSTVTLYAYQERRDLLKDITGTFRPLAPEVQELAEVDRRNLYALELHEISMPTALLPTKTPRLEEAERCLETEDFDAAISALVEIEQRGFSFEWYQSIGSEGSWIFSLSSADINSDGLDEIIAACSDGKVYAFGADGKVLWDFPSTTWFFDVCCADTNDDGHPEVICGAGDRYVYILRGLDGELLNRYEMSDRVWSVNCADVDGDGKPEIIAGLDNGAIRIFRASGAPVSEMELPGKIRDIDVCDLNHDGHPELIVSATDNRIYVIAVQTGQVLDVHLMGAWAYRVQSYDIDSDGQSEIVVASRDNRVHVLNQHAELRWDYYCADWIKGLGIADIDGDSIVELVLGRHDGLVSVIDATGELRWDFRIASWVRSIDIDDYDKDGLVEIAIGTGNGKLFCFKVAQPSSIDLLLHRALQGKIGAMGQNKEQVIATYSSSSDPYLQSFAVRELTTILTDPTSLVAEILLRADRALAENQVPVVITCLRVVDGIQGDARELANLLGKAAAHHDEQIRLEVVRTLDRLIGRGQLSAVDLLLALAKDPNPVVRRNVARVLGHHCTIEQEHVVRVLAQLRQDEDDWVTHEATHALATCCNHVPDQIIQYVALILGAGSDLDILQEMSASSNNLAVKERLHALYDLLTADRGTSLVRFYRFLAQELATQNIDQILLLQDQLISWLANPVLRTEAATAMFAEVAPILEFLQMASRLRAAADRVAALATVSDRLTSLEIRIQATALSAGGSAPGDAVSEITVRVLASALHHWRNIIDATITDIAREAIIEVELRSKDVQRAAEIEVLVDVLNVGEGPAWDIELEIKPSEEYQLTHSQTRIVVGGLEVGEKTSTTITLQPLANQAMTILLEVRYRDSVKSNLFFSAQRVTLLEPAPFQYIARNPYVPGPPIRSPEGTFFGRGDILKFIQDNLEGASGPNVLILTGRPRVGKTSILYQLEYTLEPRYVPIFIDMQARIDSSIPAFLYDLSQVIVAEMRRRGIRIRQPSSRKFKDAAGAYFAEKFLRQAVQAARNRRLLLLIDEFGAMDRLGRGIFGYMRSLLQHSTAINFVLVISDSTPDALATEEWSSILNVGHQKRIGLLDRTAIRDLATLPVQRYGIQYDSLALDLIYQVTGGHPLFAQSLCNCLVAIHNQTHSSFLSAKEVVSGVQDTLASNGAYLRYMWTHWTAHERAVLLILARRAEHQRKSDVTDILAEAAIYNVALDASQCGVALETLVADEILDCSRDGEHTSYSFRVDLVHRWITQNVSLDELANQVG